MNYLDFEDDIKALDQRVQELKAPYLAKGITAIENPTVVDAERRLNEALERAYANLNRWQKTKVARHEFRPRSIHYIQKIFPDFTNLSGDRLYGEDQSVLAGFATLDGISVLVIGQEKGNDTQSRIQRNFGMMRPEGYRKSMRLMNLADRLNIPIIADELVDPEFGTGAVKVTAAHDPNDFEMGMRHGVELVIIMNEHGVMAGTGTKFDGMDRFDARKAVVDELRKLGRVVAEKRPYVHAVGHCQRCDTTVEPRLSKQWFVKVAPLAKAAGDAVRDGRVKIEPEQMSPRYFEWVDNMHDWCISRQLWWGHRIPVFYGPNDEVVVCGPDETPPAGTPKIQMY